MGVVETISRRDRVMPLPRVRITIRMLMGVVAVAGWIVFNFRLIDGMSGGKFTPMPAGESGRVVLFTALAWLVGPAVGVGIAYASWSGLIKNGWRPVWSGLVTGFNAGFCAWFVITILLCLGDEFDGVPLVVGYVIGFVGAVNLLAGMLVGAAWGWLHRRRGGERAGEVGSCDGLACDSR